MLSVNTKAVNVYVHWCMQVCVLKISRSSVCIHVGDGCVCVCICVLEREREAKRERERERERDFSTTPTFEILHIITIYSRQVREEQVTKRHCNGRWLSHLMSPSFAR